MSRARRISKDLRNVAALAGTTAAVVEGAAIAAEKARSVTEHIAAEHADPGTGLASEVDVVVTSRRCCRKKLVLVLLIAVAAAVGFTLWKRRSAARDQEQGPVDEERFSGSMP